MGFSFGCFLRYNSTVQFTATQCEDLMTLKKIRIFISSPGDVQEERQIARGDIQQLGRTFAGRLQLQPVFWEELFK
jgi:uridine kinase